ncbi:MAG TPA: hypothetical protein VF806_10375 [Anaerolineaceae bacterium]
MTEIPQETLSATSAWGAALSTAVCEKCHWRYLVDAHTTPSLCPNCYQVKLSILPQGLPDMPHPYPPELALPFQVPEGRLAQAIQGFSKGIPFAPAGLNPTELSTRMRKIFLPVWLVDGEVSAIWQAEAGFHYDVVSYQEIYDQNRSGWKSNEAKETRVHWEDRVGSMQRTYQNLAVAAIDDTTLLDKQLGGFNLKSSEPYQADVVAQSIVRLPDHAPKEAANEAWLVFQQTAAQDCQQACAAEQIRQFRWKAQFANLNWTLQLLPVYSTFYLDDDGHPQPVLIHGQTGSITGIRKASSRRAGKTGLVLLVVSILILLIGLLLDAVLAGRYPGLSAITTVLTLAGLVGLPCAALPYIIVVDFNRRQAGERSR